MSGPAHRVLGPELAARLRRRAGRFVPADHRYEHRPPTAGARPPDVVGVGARATAGPWWFSLLAAHPDVDLTGVPPSGLHFLDKFWDRPFTAAAAHHYRSQFALADPAHRTGEWTADYLLHRWCLDHLQAAAPDAKVLVVLREPLTRALAEVEERLVAGHRFLSRVVEVAVLGSQYGRLLEQLFAVIDPDRVLVLQHEQLVADPAPHLRATHRFLGLDPAPVPAQVRPPAEPAPRLRPAPRSVFLDAVHEQFAADRERLARLVATHDLALDLDAW